MKGQEQSYPLACERYAEWGVSAEQALEVALRIPISLHCWQGDDVGGFEAGGQRLGDGLAVTGQYPGKATAPDELRTDFAKAASLIPGAKRVVLFNVETPKHPSPKEIRMPNRQKPTSLCHRAISAPDTWAFRI